MLIFGLPLALWLGLSVLPAAAFYFLRLRFRKQPAGSTYLWRKIQREGDKGRRWQWKSLLLFALQIAALLALTLAAAAPQLSVEQTRPKGVVYLLDSSASMGSREPLAASPGNQAAGGQTRWQLAVATLTHELQALPADTPVAVFRCDADAWYPEPGMAAMPAWRAADAKSISTRLLGQSASAAGFREQKVAATVQAWMAQSGGSWRAVLLSDGGPDLGGQGLAGLFGSRLSQISIGSDQPNLGLSTLRPASASSGGLEVSILNQGSASQSIELQLERDGTVIRRLTHSIPAGTSQLRISLDDQPSNPAGQDFLADFSGSASSSSSAAPLAPGLYRLSILNHADSLALDDAILLAVNPPRLINILHVGAENPYLRAALSWPGIKLVHAAKFPAPATDSKWDLVIVDGIPAPADLGGNLLFLASLPQAAPLDLGAVVSGPLKTVESSHPLARWVDWQESPVSAGQVLIPKAGVQELARVNGQAMIVAWESGSQRIVVCGTDLSHSAMGLSGAFPVFLRNLIQWCVPQADNALADTLEAGVIGWRSESTGWKIEQGSIDSLSGSGLIGLLGRTPGSATWQDGSRRGVLALNPSRAESSTGIRVLRGIALAEAGSASTPAVQSSSESLVIQRHELGLLWLPLLLGLGFLVAEWLLWYGWPDWLRPAWILAKSRPPRTRPAPSAATRRTIRPLLVMRLLALGLAVAALTGLAIPVPSQRQNLVILIDNSASQGPSLVEKSRSLARDYLSRLKPEDRAALISFAATPRLQLELTDPASALLALERINLSAADPGQTDLRSALALARQNLQASPGRSSILLISDGRPTQGGGLASLVEDGLAYPINSVALGQSASGIHAGELSAPGLTHAGAARSVPWTISSSTETELTLSTSLDGGVPGTRRLRLAAGDTVVEIPVSVQTPGRHRLEVQLLDQTGAPVNDSARATIIEVGGPARIMLVDNSSAASPLAAALVTQGFVVDRMPVSSMPSGPSGLDGVNSIILDNIGALDLTEAQQEALVNHVAAGGGLLVIGGDRSLGRGEYYSTSLETLLPVSTDERQRLLFTRSRILFVLDHSGSMGEAVGDETKLQVALKGISQAVAQFSPLDEVGILTFDSSPSWLLRFTPVSQKDTIATALGSVPEGGGTDLSVALDEVVTAFNRPGPMRRHVILLTDGETANEAEHFQELCQQLQSVGVSVTTIGIGNEVNQELLENLAEWGNGSYYRAEAAQVPQILTKETIRVTRELIQEGRFQPRFVRSGGPVAGLDKILPPVNGYLLTQARPQAQLWLAIDRPGQAGAGEDSGPAPLLASWHYGNGSVAVFTADSGRHWLNEWSKHSVYNRFWGQVLRSLEQARPDQGLQVSVTVEAGIARLGVDALDAERQLQSGLNLVAASGSNQFNLAETAPGHYQAELPLGESGLVSFTIREAGSQRSASAWAWNPPGVETSGTGADLPGLGRLSAASGGLLLPLDSVIDLPRPIGLEAWPLAWLLLLMAGLVFLVELGWRSTMTGQLPMARATIQAWWQGQRAAFERYRRGEPEYIEALHTETEQRKVMDAYRYLALRTQKRSGAASATPPPAQGSSNSDKMLDADQPRSSLLSKLGKKR